MKYIIALDIGTSSVRAAFFNVDLKIVKQEQKEIASFSPRSCWVEQDPNELWLATKEVLEKLLAEFSGLKEIVGLGITNQRETTIIWSKKDSRPIYPAIVWQDRRTDKFCAALKKRDLANKIYLKTGLRLDPYFSATKINWILDNVANAKQKAKRGELLFGTVDSWIIYKLTGGKSHVTDVSNASRTMLFNIKNLSWDKDLLKLFQIPMEILPRVLPSVARGANFGMAEINSWRVPILAVCGDQTSALYGEGCFKFGDTKATYGTGGFVVANVGKKPLFKNKNLITTIAWQKDKEVIYALEGSIFQSGGALKWLRDNLKLFNDYEEANRLSYEAKDSGGVILIPSFVGLGAPYWNSKARAAIFGLSNFTTKGHLINAAIEAAAFQVEDILDEMKKSGVVVKKIKADGGLTLNKHLLPFQADISNVIVSKAVSMEMTNRGVAALAIYSLGWIEKSDKILGVYKNKLKPLARDVLKKKWRQAIGNI